jgi:hypothetical protein
MRCADAAAVVAMEVFVEEDVIFEVGIGREFGMVFEHGPLAVLAF